MNFRPTSPVGRSISGMLNVLTSLLIDGDDIKPRRVVVLTGRPVSQLLSRALPAITSTIQSSSITLAAARMFHSQRRKRLQCHRRSLERTIPAARPSRVGGVIPSPRRSGLLARLTFRILTVRFYAKTLERSLAQPHRRGFVLSLPSGLVTRHRPPRGASSQLKADRKVPMCHVDCVERRRNRHKTLCSALAQEASPKGREERIGDN